MENAIEFIKKNFKNISTLKSIHGNITEIVLGDNNVIYIRKTIAYVNLPYKKLANIKHLFLPKIYYVAEDEHNTYVIEEYVDGQNLQNILKVNGYFDEKLVKKIALQACSALETLHINNILHRDIKPSNIILKDDGNIKIIDFGAAKIISTNIEHDTRILGTPGFAPPEQYGFSATDVRSDFYALGMTMKALVGAKYNGKLLKVINKCIQLDPNRRIASTDELRKMLESSSNKLYKVMFIVTIMILIGVGYYCWISNKIVEENQSVQNHVETMENKNTESKLENKRNIKNAEDKVKKQEHLKGDKENINLDNKKLENSKKPITNKINKIDFISNNWDEFLIVSEGAIKDQFQRSLERKGFILVKHKDGKWPVFIIKNDSLDIIKNPQIEMSFDNFFVQGKDFEVDSWGGHVEKTIFSDIDENGLTRRVSVKIIGEISVNDYYQIGLFGGINGYYVFGDSPSVRIVFTADNAEMIEKQYNIIIQ